jgi:hypothetical protein
VAAVAGLEKLDTILMHLLQMAVKVVTELLLLFLGQVLLTLEVVEVVLARAV